MKLVAASTGTSPPTRERIEPFDQDQPSGSNGYDNYDPVIGTHRHAAHLRAPAKSSTTLLEFITSRSHGTDAEE
jgi:hypothetical protein